MLLSTLFTVTRKCHSFFPFLRDIIAAYVKFQVLLMLNIFKIMLCTLLFRFIPSNAYLEKGFPSELSAIIHQNTPSTFYISYFPIFQLAKSKQMR